MTTDSSTHRATAANLFEPNDVFNLPTIEGFTQPIAAVSFSATRQSIEVPWCDVLSIAIDSAINYLTASQYAGRQWMFFGANDMWRAPTAVIRHKKFWRASNTLTEVRSRLQNRSPDIEFTYDSKIRYAVCAEIHQEMLLIFGEWIRSSRSGLLLLESSVEKLTADNVRHCFTSVFYDGKSDVDWSRAVTEFCVSGSILVRCRGSFDDAAAVVDLIYDPKLVTLT